MPDLRTTRNKLKIAIAAMVVADALAIAILFSPLVGSAESRRLQMLQLSAELTKKTHEVQPLQGMDKKLLLAKDQIGDFYKDRFAEKDSELATELGKLATKNGIRSSQLNIKRKNRKLPASSRSTIEGSFSGDYLQLVRFINTLERSKIFFTVDSVDLAGEGAGQVRLQIRPAQLFVAGCISGTGNQNRKQVITLAVLGANCAARAMSYAFWPLLPDGPAPAQASGAGAARPPSPGARLLGRS